MLMNIDKELEKMLKYLKDNLKIRPIEITDNWDNGKKVFLFHFYFDEEDQKMRKREYSFYIDYDKDRNNYWKEEYLMHVDMEEKNSSMHGTGYATPYHNINDFINDKTVKELVGGIEESEDVEEEIETLEGQMSLFDEEEPKNIEEIQFNFEDLEEEDPVEELLAYGVDKYYYEMMKKWGCMTFNRIKEELSKLPNYKEYMEKFGKYLKSQLPLMTYEMVGNDFNKKCLIETDTIGYRINGNRQQYTAYCLQQYMKTTEHKSLF